MGNRASLGIQRSPPTGGTYSETPLRAFLPTDAWIRRSLAPILVFVAMVSDHGYLCDFWHHLARGRAMVDSGGLVDHDLFTFTIAGQPFQDVNWLSQLLYFALFQMGGLGLVQVVNALVLAGTLALLIEVCRLRARDPSTSAPAGDGDALFWASLVAVGVFVGIWQLLSIRPQTFSMFLFVLLLYILERSPGRSWILAIPPFVIALWTNLHGAFPAGLMLIGCYLAAKVWTETRAASSERLWRRLAPLSLCLGVSTLATLANPYGWSIYHYVLQTSGRATARQIDEWLPPSWDLWVGKAFAISLVTLFVLLALAWRKGYRPSARDVLLTACFLPLACMSARMVAWWLFILAPIATMLLVVCRKNASETETELSPSLGAGLTFGVLALIAVFSLPGLQSYNPLLRLRQHPRVEDDLEAAHTYLRSRQANGRIFTRFEWGEYLSWSCTPAFPIYMDGRIELYPDEVWNQYSVVTRGQQDWQTVLDSYQVDVLIADGDYHQRTGLLAEVASSAEWQKTFTSRNVEVYLRQPHSAAPAAWESAEARSRRTGRGAD